MCLEKLSEWDEEDPHPLPLPSAAQMYEYVTSWLHIHTSTLDFYFLFSSSCLSRLASLRESDG